MTTQSPRAPVTLGQPDLRVEWALAQRVSPPPPPPKPPRREETIVHEVRDFDGTHIAECFTPGDGRFRVFVPKGTLAHDRIIVEVTREARSREDRADWRFVEALPRPEPVVMPPPPERFEAAVARLQCFWHGGLPALHIRVDPIGVDEFYGPTYLNLHGYDDAAVAQVRALSKTVLRLGLRVVLDSEWRVVDVVGDEIAPEAVRQPFEARAQFHNRGRRAPEGMPPAVAAWAALRLPAAESTR